jgi:hypothetical protein
MIDRVHNPPYPPPNGLPNTTQQQEYLKSQLTQPFDYVRRIIDLETRVANFEAALAEIFEMWAGSEGFIPHTAPEGYLLELIKKMADRAALAKGESK